MDKKINFAFFGTPDVAAETLEILKEAGFLPSLVVTSPDARQGRKMLLYPPPAKVWAETNNIPLIQPESIADLVALPPSEQNSTQFDLFIVVAYGKILPKSILSIPRLGAINIHYSLLPKYRGASPVESAILNGETETGVSIQKMVYKMDAGPVIAKKIVKILPDETAPELRKRLIKIGGELLVKTLQTPSADSFSSFAGGEEQDESQATYCKKIKKEDGLVDLATEPPSELYNKFRAYALWPRTFFFQNGKRVIITDAVLEDGKFVIKKIIPEGGKEINYKSSIYAMT